MLQLYKVWRWVKRHFLVGAHVAHKDLARRFAVVPFFVVLISFFGVVYNVHARAVSRSAQPQSILELLFSGVEDVTTIEAVSTYDLIDTSIPAFTALENHYLGVGGPVSTSTDVGLSDPVVDMTGALVRRDAVYVPPSRTGVIDYEVQHGDTISAIAERYSISTNTILWANQLSPYSIIRPGETLKILPTSGVVHTVKKNDTLSAIAQTYDVTVDVLQEANELVSEHQLRVGVDLVIPGGKKPVVVPRKTTTRLASFNKLFVASTDSGDASTSGFIWPAPQTKRITQYYWLRHKAIDVGGKLSYDLVASKAGRVEFAGWSNGYGYNVVINHGDGIKTRSAHMSKIFVSVGQRLEQGEVFGKIGSTGRSTGPHVHFEIMINGKKVNPLTYL